VNNEFSYETLKVEKVGDHVMLITLNRPEVFNAVDMQMTAEFEDLESKLEYDPDWVRCTVMTGAGRAFCAGGDLKVRNTQSIGDWTLMHEIGERLQMKRIECAVPRIAAINGICYAGGLELAMTSDFIYADTGARFAITECKIGIMPGGMGTQTLGRAVGERRAKEIVLAGAPFSAEDALAWNLVNRVCSAGTVVEEALATAQLIAENAPLSVRHAKKAIHFGLQTDIRTGYRLELEAYYRLLDTADRREGIAAFNEKRKPQFVGK
jgi:enoyl-CoA hydratase/carnithine racemase